MFAFTLTSYTVPEDVGDAPVAVNLISGVLDRSVAVIVTTSDFQAIGKAVTEFSKSAQIFIFLNQMISQLHFFSSW